MEIKLKINEIESISEGGDYYLKDLYLDHIPELWKLKHLPFYKVVLKSGQIWYVGMFARKKEFGVVECSPGISKHYSRNKPKSFGPTSITIKCNRLYHMIANSYALV